MAGLALAGLALSSVASARPYPTQTGLTAAADSAVTAANNPAGMTRFDERNFRGEFYLFYSESTWQGSLDTGSGSQPWRSDDDGTTFIPVGHLVQPINDKWWFGFTFLGNSFSEDFGDDWAGRYFMQEYELLSVSAFPSLAYKVNDKLSVAGSLALAYTSFEQSKAVRNFLDPGEPDGKLEIDNDGFDIGFSVSMLYEFTDKTRVGAAYRTEVDSDLDGDTSFSGLADNTRDFFDTAGLLDLSIDTSSTSPQAINAGIYHEFEDQGAVTFDLVWLDFSSFVLSEIYINDNQVLDNSPDYDDIWAASLGYTWPLNDKWMLGVGALYISDMVDDDERSLTLRLDDAWGAGVGVQYAFSPTRRLNATLDYYKMNKAPVSTPQIDLPGGGSLVASGRFTDRAAYLFRLSLDFGSGAR